MKISELKQNEAKKQKCTINELIFADLLSIGYSEEDAYEIAFPGDKQLKGNVKSANIKSMTNSMVFKNICENRRKKNASFLSVTNDTDDIELIGSSDVAKEILMAAKKQPLGSKERADLMIKYNDLCNDNKNKVNTSESDPVQFFFSISCDKCPLLQRYNEMVATRNAGLPRDKWDLEVRPDEMQRLIEQSDTDIRQMRKKERDRQKGA